MKTRFTLTSLALASLMMMGNTAMAETTKDGFFNVPWIRISSATLWYQWLEQI